VIGDCILAEPHILGKELKLAQAINNYEDALAELDRVQVYSSESAPRFTRSCCPFLKTHLR